MSSFIDPITGVPYDALSNTLYSIPLNSQPALAPEWNPQGRITSTVYPDNMPTVFATLQAQNEQNPSNVQALTTDGSGNLNVNSVGGGGGGSPIFAPTLNSWEWDTATSATSPLFNKHTGITLTRLWRIHVEVAWSEAEAGFGEAEKGAIAIASYPNGSEWYLGVTWAVPRPGFAAGSSSDRGVLEIMYPNGWAAPPFIVPGDTQVRVLVYTSGFINGISSTLDYS